MNLNSLYALPFTTIIAITVLALMVWTVAGICIRKHRSLSLLWCVVNTVLSIVSLAGILNYTIINRAADAAHAMPFIRTIEHIQAQPELIREMLMNAFLFFPFGLTAPYALESLPDRNGEKRRRPAFITMAAAFLLTCGIELTQYLCSFGNCELSDIIMNILGAAIGTVPFTVSSRQTE